MKIKHTYLFIILILSAFFLASCKNESPTKSNRVVVGITADIESLNPLFTFTLDEGQISELLYLSLVKHDWDDEKGNLKVSPMLAEKWEWSDDSLSIIFNLRNNINWRDGKTITAEDVVFSFDLYSDPNIQSRLYGYFEKFYLEKDLHINLKKTFEIIGPKTVKINFVKGSAPTLFDVDVPIIPKHIFEKLDRKNLITLEKGIDSVTSGPFYLERWDKNQAIILRKNEKSFLYNSTENRQNISELIFKVVPDYNSRLTQLKKGEIDLMEDVNPGDVDEIGSNENINISSVKGRNYDYVAWNNINPKIFEEKNLVKSNELFGFANIRKALTYSINRKEILSEFLNNKGSIAVSPVPDIFKNAFNDSIENYNYDPQKAKQILEQEGWKDIDKDGILEKGGKKFSFTIYYPSGNPLRDFAAAIIKNNLKAVGIEANTSSVEPGVFFEKAFSRKYDAWMAGWSIAIPLDLKPFWFSDLKETPNNLAGYQGKKMDEILLKLDSKITEEEKNKLYKKAQEIIHNDEPVTFLYWIDNIVAYNKRINDITISPLGAVQKCWEWKVAQ
ncbi:MAG: ABC transporter substrate-binding protein [Ignavibacteriaceae bacterium]